MSLTFYHFSASGPSRGALLAARAIGAVLNIEQINLFKKEQLNENFVKINPQHCVPTLVDDNFVLWESRAIACYLADKYGKEDDLYPKDLRKRALVNQRLYFDASNLYVKIRAICFPILYHGVTEISQGLKADLNCTLSLLDHFVSDSTWVAGKQCTIADCCIPASMSTILSVGWDISTFPNIKKWLKQCENIPGFDGNLEGAKIFGDAIRSKLVQHE